jgi:hypothetical protein
MVPGQLGIVLLSRDFELEVDLRYWLGCSFCGSGGHLESRPGDR